MAQQEALLLLAWCVVYGILFMVWQIFDYEEYQHGEPHTRIGHSLSLLFGIQFARMFWNRLRVAGYLCNLVKRIRAAPGAR